MSTYEVKKSPFEGFFYDQYNQGLRACVRWDKYAYVTPSRSLAAIPIRNAVAGTDTQPESALMQPS